MPSSAELLPLVYDQLRRIAQQRLAQERPGHTLQATALVHEAYVRLAGAGAAPHEPRVGDDPSSASPGHLQSWDGRAHFFAAAAEAMRRILIEHARAKGRSKRGGGAARLPLSVVDLAEEADPEEILAVDEAIRRLEQRDGRLAQIVQLRFYAGLNHEETAAIVGASERTVRRDWELARALLLRELGAVDDARDSGA